MERCSSRTKVASWITDDEDEGTEEPIDDPSRRQPVVAELKEDEDEKELSGALPSHSERGHCSAEGSTRRSERERKTPGKFLDYMLQFDKNTAGRQFTDSSESAMMTSGLNAGAFVENRRLYDGVTGRRPLSASWSRSGRTRRGSSS